MVNSLAWAPRNVNSVTRVILCFTVCEFFVLLWKQNPEDTFPTPLEHNFRSSDGFSLQLPVLQISPQIWRGSGVSKEVCLDKQRTVPFTRGLSQGLWKTLLMLPVEIAKMGERENQSHFSIYLCEQRIACGAEQIESTKLTPNKKEKKLYLHNDVWITVDLTECVPS